MCFECRCGGDHLRGEECEWSSGTGRGRTGRQGGHCIQHGQRMPRLTVPSTPHERDSKGFKGHTHKGKENKSTSRWRSECRCGRPTAEGAGTVRSQQAGERSSPLGWERSRHKASPCSLQNRRAQELATVASEGGWWGRAAKTANLHEQQCQTPTPASSSVRPQPQPPDMPPTWQKAGAYMLDSK